MSKICSTLSREFLARDPLWFAVDDFGDVGHWHESELTSTDGMYRTREEAESAQRQAEDHMMAEAERRWNIGR